MKQRYEQFGRPTVVELAILMQNLSSRPSQLLTAIGVGGLIASTVPASAFAGWALPGGFLVIALAFCAGIATLYASAPLFGWQILSAIERDYGDGSAAKVVAWHRQAKDGDLLDLDRIIGHPPRR